MNEDEGPLVAGSQPAHEEGYLVYLKPSITGNEAQDLLEPLAVSWDWAEDEWADRHRWHGTKDPTPYLAVPAAIDFQAERDWPSVRSRCHTLAVRARRELSDLLGTEPLAVEETEFVQMCSVRLPARTDLPKDQLPQWAQDVLAQMKPAHYARALVAAHGAEWMEKWDREIRGHGAKP